MTEPPSRREMQPARRASDRDLRDEAMEQVWRAADPPPAGLAAAAKAAFTAARGGATVLPITLDIRAPDHEQAQPDGGDHTSLLVFGAGDRSSVAIEVELSDRTVAGLTLQCTVRNAAGAAAAPMTVAVETEGGIVALVELRPGVYHRSAVPAGPTRIVVSFPDQAGRSVVTSWFTA